MAPFTRHVTDKVTSGHVDEGHDLGGSHLRPLTWALVEVKGLEPSASTLRTYGSRRFDQALSEEIAGRGVAIPSGCLSIPPLPAR